MLANPMDILPTLGTGLDASSSNLYVKGLPSSIDEEALVDIFSRFGDIRSCHILPSTRPGATNIGYVHLSSPEQARDAITALNGASTERGVLEVRPSPPAAGRQQTPCDNLYVRNLPTTWTEQDLRELFSPYGNIQECRILHRGDDLRGAGALVRMSTIDQAANAIAALNGLTPRGAVGEALTSQPLLVRYADSPEEKARKQARKEQLAQQRLHRSLDLPPLTRESSDTRHSSLPNGFLYSRAGALDASLFSSDSLQADTSAIENLLSSLGPPAATHTLDPLATSAAITLNCLSPSKGLLQPPTPPPPAGCASLYVKNLPPETDKLWLYERFAPHGAILSVKVLLEENSHRCRGVGFVNYADSQGALNAIQNVHGVKVADKVLHVSLQTNRRT